MSEPLDLEDRVPPGATRVVVDLASELTELPVTSELTRSFPLLPGVSDVRRVSRVLLGPDSRRVLVVVEHGDGRTVAYVRGAFPPLTLRPRVEEDGTPWAPGSHLLRDHERDELRGTLRADDESVSALDPRPASNERVAELTRGVHDLAGRTGSSAVRSALRRLPTVSDGLRLPGDRVGGAHRLLGAAELVEEGLALLRDLASGVPEEWALRRLSAPGDPW